MYLLATDKVSIRSKHSSRIDLDISKVFKVVQTPACSPGEYALFCRDDEDTDKFTIFQGYIMYDDICKYFEMIKWNQIKSETTKKKTRRKKESTIYERKSIL